MSVTIRQARHEDLHVIVEYNQRLASETEGKSLPSEIITAGVDALLKDDRKGFYLLAEKEGQIVGQLMITTEWSDWRNGWMWWVQSVYVHPDHRRQGVYRRLYEEIVSQAQAREDVAGIRLYVEKDNHRAQQTYQSLGMDFPGYLVMEQSASSD